MLIILNNDDDDEKDDKRRQVEVGRIGPLIVYPQHLHPPCRVHLSRLGCNINMMTMIIMMIIMILINLMILVVQYTSRLYSLVYCYGFI